MQLILLACFVAVAVASGGYDGNRYGGGYRKVVREYRSHGDRSHGSYVFGGYGDGHSHGHSHGGYRSGYGHSHGGYSNDHSYHGDSYGQGNGYSLGYKSDGQLRGYEAAAARARGNSHYHNDFDHHHHH